MKRIVTTTALALVLGLSAGAGLTAPPAKAADCIRTAALDLNGDGWIDGEERDMARSAGFRSFDANGDLYVSAQEMDSCLRGGSGAFAWLRSANANYASTESYVGRSVSPVPSASYAPAPMTSYSYDRGAAYDTPAPIAHDAALAYLKSKVERDPRYAPRVATVYTPVVQPTPQIMYQIEPASGADPMSDFARMDANNDGVVTDSEYLNYRALNY